MARWALGSSTITYWIRQKKKFFLTRVNEIAQKVRATSAVSKIQSLFSSKLLEKPRHAYVYILYTTALPGNAVEKARPALLSATQTLRFSKDAYRGVTPIKRIIIVY